eukprot:CAMPEP_0204195584 /NCGR_PEP_ID=MMETSP0361-20130328/63208_1 /ASSEMBLY_ACC=CAM_ASM_000343 /TAXON_ID=268821 /ORGANISM="Scrippsiella Hangoei, Strain SHTV-5" /LENGTH=115 /DNA_ID=CAMNT_0051157179 /DNA_START=58 /DNA_END=406 /DNA_ORIENTATION=-
MLVAWINAAQWLVTRGVATAEDVDRTWMIAILAPKGPMGVMDMVGLETGNNIKKHWGRVIKDEMAGKQMLANAEWLEAKLQAAHSGLKGGDPLTDTAQGHYSYPNPAHMQEGFMK